MKISLDGIKISAIICFLGAFVTSSALRAIIISPDSVLYKFDILTYIGLFLIVYYDRRYSSEKPLFQHNCLIMYIFTVVFVAINYTVNGIWHSWYGGFISIVIPSIIIFYKFERQDSLFDAFRTYVAFLRASVFFVYIGIIIDLVNEYSFSNFIAKVSENEYLVRMASYYGRIVTFLGHPLYTTEILLAYYVFNHIYKDMLGEREGIGSFVLSGIGIALCQSKTGIVLIIAAFLLYNLKFEKAITLIVAMIMGVMLYSVGLFDGIISRFIIDIQRGDITSGRNSLFKQYLANGLLDFKMFQGHQFNMKVLTPLEYPILRWAYMMGIVSAALLVVVYFVLPAMKILLSKQSDVIVAMIILMVDVNTYSSIGDSGKHPVFYCIMMCLLINISIYKYDLSILENSEVASA